MNDVVTAANTGHSAPCFPYPVALCDIGGTNVRIAEVVDRGAPVRAVAHIGTGEHASLAAAVLSCRDAFSSAPRSLIVCAAGPVDGRTVKLTNARWTIEGPRVAQALGLDQGLLLNDFEAQAIMLPNLRAESTRAIGSVGAESEDGAHLVLGPGTGLGVGLLVPWQGRMMPVMTEAGHMDFGATTPLEVQVWNILRRTLPRITGESLLSGPGTVRLYHALCELEGVQPKTDDAAQITELANHSDGIEARCLRMFWILVARFAGSLTLGFVAKGGVTLSGGILKKIVNFLDPAEFRRAFDDQQPLQSLVANVPVRLVMDDRSVLDGLAALAANPGRFMLDYPARYWVP